MKLTQTNNHKLLALELTRTITEREQSINQSGENI